MSKHCTGCKREISWGQNDCPFCGTPQSKVRHYFPYLAGLTVVLSSAYWLASTYLEDATSNIREKVQLELGTQLEAERETIQNLNQQISQLQQQLDASEAELSQLKSQQSSNLNEVQTENEALKTQLQTAEQEAERQKGRADWLGRENVRLKGEVESLKQQLTEIQQRQQPLIPAQSEPPIPIDEEETPPSQDDGDGQ